MALISKTVKILLPPLVLGAFFWGARLIVAYAPEAQRRPPPPPPRVQVDALRLNPRDYQVYLYSQGSVRPRTEGTLVAQVGGQVVEVARNLREGGFFSTGDVLARIDPSDYDIAVTVAEAELARAEAALAEEQARAQLAVREQRQMGTRGGTALALREPQLAAARATVAAAGANLARARLDRQRTVLTAPYDGRVLRQHVDVGQVIGVNTALADIYATDSAQIRLPLNGRDLDFLRLPETPGAADGVGEAGLPVTVSARLGRHTYRWRGRVVRSEGAFDAQSRQLFVIAQIDDPYRRGGDAGQPLRVGQFVNAEIRGERLHDVYVVPRAALAEGEEALLIDREGRLQRRRVEVLWRDAETAVLADRLTPGTLLSLTPLPGVLSGTPLRVNVVGGADGADAVVPDNTGDGPGPADTTDTSDTSDTTDTTETTRPVESSESVVPAGDGQAAAVAAGLGAVAAVEAGDGRRVAR